MKFNQKILESIVQDKTKLKTVNQLCKEIYGFDAFGFYNPKQPNHNNYFIRQIENSLHSDERTKNITSNMVYYLYDTYVYDDNSKPNQLSRREKLIHWMFNTPIGKENNVLKPSVYAKMTEEKMYSKADQDDIITFLSNPDKNNDLYEVYFRHFVFHFLEKNDEKYNKSDIYHLPIGTSIYEGLKNWYSSIWKNITNKVPNLVENCNCQEKFLDHEILRTTGFHFMNQKDDIIFEDATFKIKDKKTVEVNFSSESVTRNIAKNKDFVYFDCDKVLTIIDSDKAYSTVVGIKFSDLHKILSKKFGCDTENNRSFSLSFRAIYDEPIKCISFGLLPESNKMKPKDENNTIFLSIVPEKLSNDGKFQYRSFHECKIQILVEISEWFEKKPDGGSFHAHNETSKDKLIVGVIPIRLLLMRYYWPNQ